MLALVYAAPSRTRRYAFERTVISPMGVPAALVRVGIPERAGARRRDRALRALADLLRGERVSRLVLEEGFPERDALLALGFREADSACLLGSLAGEIAASGALSRFRALLCVRDASARSLDTARDLAKRFRRLSLVAPAGVRDAVFEAVAPLGVTPEAAGPWPDADAAVFFSEPPRPVYLPARCRVLRLCAPTPNIAGGRETERLRFTVPARCAVRLPARFPLSPILSTALEWGRIRPEEITVNQQVDII